MWCYWCEAALTPSKPSYTHEAVHEGRRFTVVFCKRRCEKAWKKDVEQYGTT